MPKAVFITQARMGSTRLPGKILNKFEGNPLLYWFMKRALRAKNIDKFVVATTTDEKDDLISELIHSELPKVHITRGSEEDVLSRYAQAAQETDADVIVRATSDCPFLDWELIDHCIEQYNNNGCDALRTLRSDFPIGLDIEVFSRQALDQAAKEAMLKEEREHVGPYIFNNPEKFNIYWVKNEVFQWPECRLTLDYPEDLQLVKRLYADVGALAESNKYGEYLFAHPEIAQINLKYSK